MGSVLHILIILPLSNPCFEPHDYVHTSNGTEAPAHRQAEKFYKLLREA